MTDLQAIADRVEIEALRGEFTDAAMMRDRARLASLFTPRRRVADAQHPRRAGSRHPIPQCADPHGYYALFLARITAAGDNAASASGLSALLLAEALLQTVPKLENRLAAELNRTVGKNR